MKKDVKTPSAVNGQPLNGEAVAIAQTSDQTPDVSTKDGEISRPAEAERANASEPEPTPPAPVVVKSVAEQVADQTAKLKKLNQTVTQIANLEAMKANLDRLTVDESDERSFAAIVIVDDLRRETKFTNAGLVALNIDWLADTLAAKLAEKQAELLAVSLQ